MTKSSHLAALLEAFHPDDAAQRRFLERMRELNERGERAFARDHFEPGHFTASAFILDTTGERLLLILHGKLAKWLQPGGHVDPDDVDVIAAARREVREEVGLADVVLAHDGIYDIDIHDIPALKTDPAHRHFDVRFLFRSESDEVVAATDAREVRWVELDRVHEVQSDASVMRAVARLRRR